MSRGHDSLMHEDVFSSERKTFSLVPDPDHLYRGAAHGRVVAQLQQAIASRTGFALLTGEAGTGKTTVCRAVVSALDRRTFTSVVADSSLSEEELLRVILQDFGLVSRDELKRGRLAHASKTDLLAALENFLDSIRPLGAAAVLIIDQAQDVPLETLEQITALASSQPGKEKPLQIVLVGEPILKDLLASPLVRELNAKITTRLELHPLTAEETSAYVQHRLTTDGTNDLEFEPAALAAVHRHSGGVPRLINLVCDSALLGARHGGLERITPSTIDNAAAKLELRISRGTASTATRKRMPLIAAGLVLVTLAAGYAWNNRSHSPSADAPETAGAPGLASPTLTERAGTAPTPGAAPPAAATESTPRTVADAAPVTGESFSVLVASFRQSSEASALIDELRKRGLPVREIRVVSSARGVWHQVLVGPYPDAAAAAGGLTEVRQIRGYADAHVIPG